MQTNVTNSDITNIVADIVKTAKQKPGVTAVAATGSISNGLSTQVRLGEVETVEFNRDKSIDIVVYKQKSKGAVAISDFGKDAITSAIAAACRIADYTEADQYAGLAETELLATEFPDLDLYHPAAVSADQAIAYAQQIEAAALGYDPRIKNTDGAVFSSGESFFVYANSDNFLQGVSKTSFNAYCTALAAANGKMQRDYDYTVARNINSLEAFNAIGIRAAQKTLARLGAQKLKTCTAPVLFVPQMARGIWGTLISAISGGALYRKSSFLLDKLGSKIFPDFVNIAENPFLKGALGSACFDDDGVATQSKNIIANGKLETYLLSCYAARRLGMKSAGNAGGVFNLIIEPGALGYEGLLQKMGTGLVVTELMGQGTNIVSGDYSHAAFGYWVENGKIQYPVEEITIAGNLVDIFQNIVAIGNDVDYRGNTITGSVLIDAMTIAGT
jgi:PmbA protein